MNKPILETARLRIRNFEEKDMPQVLELWSNPVVNCFVPDQMDTAEQARQYICRANAEYDFAVCLKENDRMIGALFGMSEEADTFSPCWNFLPEHCGRGYATEAATAYFNYLFYKKNIRRIYAYTEDNNLASQNVCRKLGMREEGLFREFISFVNHPDGTPKYENTYQFALLKKEWEQRADISDALRG